MTPNGAGERLARLRSVRGKSQAELGDALGVDQTVISKVERGVAGMSPELAEGAAAYFEVRPGFLLFGEGEEPAGLAAAFEQGFTEALRIAKAALGEITPPVTTGQLSADEQAVHEALAPATVKRPAGGQPRAQRRSR